MPIDRAAEIISQGDPKAILKLGFDAQLAAEDGHYCTCIEPIVHDLDLLCGACLLNNQEQERTRVRRVITAHEFIAREDIEVMCAVCTSNEEDPRHHGVHGVGLTSWGERIEIEEVS